MHIILFSSMAHLPTQTIEEYAGQIVDILHLDRTTPYNLSIGFPDEETAANKFCLKALGPEGLAGKISSAPLLAADIAEALQIKKRAVEYCTKVGINAR